MPYHLHARGRLRATVLATVLALPLAASAQDDAQRIRDLERKLQESMRLIEQLTQRVNDLERGKAPAAPAATAGPPAAATPAATQARIDALEKTVSDMATAPRATDFGVPLHGFADVGYEHTTNPGERRAGFAIGNLDLYLTPSFGNRIKTLAELVFEVAEDGSLATDLERLQLGYTVSDALTLWMGRFHTPYGYWNAAFHHGAQIQTSVTRPRFIDFEDKGGILPAHSVGLWATGQARVGNGRLHYDAYLANGDRIDGGVLDFNAARDDNSNKLVGFNVGYAPRGPLEGLLFGLHGFQFEADGYEDGIATSRTRVKMAGGYFFYDANNWEGIGEYYRFRDTRLDGAGGGTMTSWAGFLQLGYTLSDLWTPFYRYEKTSLDQNDPFFALQESGRSYDRHVFGLRYNLSPQSALKLEGNRTRETAESRSYNEWRAQFAIRF